MKPQPALQEIMSQTIAISRLVRDCRISLTALEDVAEKLTDRDLREQAYLALREMRHSLKLIAAEDKDGNDR